MSPQTRPPQDAYKVRGTWWCRTCGAHANGGAQDSFYRHWFRTHYHASGGMSESTTNPTNEGDQHDETNLEAPSHQRARRPR